MQGRLHIPKPISRIEWHRESRVARIVVKSHELGELVMGGTLKTGLCLQQDPLRLSTAHRSGLLIRTSGNKRKPYPLTNAERLGRPRINASANAPLIRFVLTFTPRPERSEAGFSFGENDEQAA